MALDEQAGEIAAPVAANPSKTLAQIFRPVLQRRLHLCLFVVLHGNLPIMSVHPPRDEVVIIGIELARPPLFMGKAMRKGIVLKDAAAVGDCSARETGQTAIDVQARRTIEVATFEVRRPQETPDAHVLGSLQPLRRPHATHLGIFKRRQHPLQHLGRPLNIIIHKDGDLGRHLWYRPAHLPALVRFPYAQDADLLGIDLVGQLVEVLDVVVDGHEQQLVGFCGQT